MTIYTCKGKGGHYEVLNFMDLDGTTAPAVGAGTMTNYYELMVYRDLSSGYLYYRTLGDFNDRMRPLIKCPDCEATRQELEKIELAKQ